MHGLTQGIQEAPNIHPLFLHFPLVLLPIALSFWVLALARRRDDLFRFGRWLLYMAVISMIAAAWTGLAAEEQVGHDTRLHELIHEHKAFMLVSTALALLMGVATVLLAKTRDFGTRLGLTTFLAATVAVMVVGADQGGHAVFGHGIGTRAQRDGPLPEVPHPELEGHKHPAADKKAPREGSESRDHPHAPESDEARDGRAEKRDHPPAARHENHGPQEHREEKSGQEQPKEHQEHAPGKAMKGEGHRPEQMSVSGPLGLSHSREASGTSWQPDSTPMHAIHFMDGDWTFMLHGNVFLGYDYQSGKRGGDEWISTHWFMFMARHPLGGGELAIRTMLSLEPATVGRDGYPLLLQSGESLGDEPLHDDQHAHDLFMELAASCTHPLTEDVGLQLYAAPSGEPALGPTAFPHRMSASSDPFAPLGHHWQDSTHISFGVLTAGVFTKYAKLEGSWFNGREPDENRWDFDIRSPDSYSGRFTVNPGEYWSAQISYGHLRSPEKPEPDVSLSRATASVTFNQPWGEEGNWATTLAWGRNKPEGENATNSLLVESSWEIDRHHTPFARFEVLKKSGHDLVLTPGLDDDSFGIGSMALGYIYNFDPIGSIIPGLGFRFSVNLVEDGLEPFYGRRTPYGFMVFLRLWPTKTEGEAHPKEHH